MAHFGNNEPPKKVATPSYTKVLTTTNYKQVPTLLGHHFRLIPFLVMERGVNMENKLSKGAHYPHFVLPNTCWHQQVATQKRVTFLPLHP